ncbi:MAG: hypothetical protein WCF46_14345, partial [Nitrososphaeraceae archaeon]
QKQYLLISLASYHHVLTATVAVLILEWLNYPEGDDSRRLPYYNRPKIIESSISAAFNFKK